MMMRAATAIFVLTACGESQVAPAPGGSVPFGFGSCVGALPVEIIEVRGIPDALTVGERSHEILVFPRDARRHQLFAHAVGATVDLAEDEFSFRVTAREPGPLTVVIGLHDGCTYDIASVALWAEPGPTVAVSLINLLSLPVDGRVDGEAAVLWSGVRGLSARLDAGRAATVRIESTVGGEVATSIPAALSRATAVVFGPPDAPSLVAFDDAVPAPEPGAVGLRFVHGVADLGAFDIHDVAGGQVLVEGVARGQQAEATLSLPPGPVALGIDVDRDGRPDLFVPTFTAVGSEALRVGLTRAPDGSIRAVVQAIRTDPIAFVEPDAAVLPPSGELVSWTDVARCDQIADLGVGVGLDHPAGGGVEITLQGPGGELLELQPGDDPARPSTDPWFLGAQVASPASADLGPWIGASGAGRWTLWLADQHGVESGAFSGFTLALRCEEGP